MNASPESFIDKVDDYWWVVVLGAIIIGEGLLRSHGITVIGAIAGLGLGAHAFQTRHQDLS